jgi:hypothetical protein
MYVLEQFPLASFDVPEVIDALRMMLGFPFTTA